MSRRTPILRRFSELSPEADPQRVADLIRSAQAAPDDELPSLRWRVRTSLYRGPLRRRLILRVAMVAVGVFAAGTVVGAISGPFLARKASRPDPTTTTNPESRPKTARAHAEVELSEPLPATEPHPALESPPAEKTEEPAPLQRPRAHRSRSWVKLAVIPPPVPAEAPLPPPPSPIAVEQSMLSKVVRTLRTQHDPRVALSLLDEHAKAFPQTTLAPEAALLRAESLLAVGRSSEALVQLDGVSLGTMPHGDDWLALRGELRATAGRWREADRDFEQALLAARGRDIVERALWGRASARSRLGDEAGSRADLSAYLRTFPSGRFSVQAAALLRGTP